MQSLQRIEELKDQIEPLFGKQIIENDSFTLHINRSRDMTTYQYHIKNHWTDTVSGTIIVGNRFRRIENSDSVEVDVSTSSGGHNDDWELDNILDNVVALQDLHKRLSDNEEEVSHIKNRMKILDEHDDLVLANKNELRQIIVDANPLVATKELKRVIKQAANLGELGSLEWTLVGSTDISKRSFIIKPDGIYGYFRKPKTQKKVLAEMEGKAISIKIIKNSEV
jgi:hypothetical protein